MMRFGDVVRSEAALRDVLGPALPRSLKKEITRLDVHCRALIAKSPFVLISSSDAGGRCDLSPRGDPAGFVQVLDEHTLAIPDRPGNRRADTFSNVLQNPRVGLLFLVPGKLETLRVNGRAQIVRDLALRESMQVAGKLPALVLLVGVEQAFIHCGKCMIRSSLWDCASWPELGGLPSQAQCLVDHGGLQESVSAVEQAIQESRRTMLY